MTAPTQSSETPRLSPIGRPGKPIRVLAFAGGGFDTAMQLGVVHALLVSRARAPDIVIGCSAGAVSAVALAEVLQAGDIDDPGPKVARFRELFEAYRRAPGEIAQALAPDPTQVDTQRPLEPLELPVHHAAERSGRMKAVAARAGLLNLYNTLLNVRLTIGTMARATRCWLGWQAAREIRNGWTRAAARLAEGVRAWLLLGENLNRAATLLSAVFSSARPGKPPRKEGATAAELIFASTLLRSMRQHIVDAAWALVLLGFWLVVSAGALLLIALLGMGILRIMGSSGPLLLPGLLLGVLVMGLAFVGLTQPRSPRAFLGVFGAFATAVLFLTLWAAVLSVALSIPLLLTSAYNTLVDHHHVFSWPWMYPPLYWILAPASLAVLGSITAFYLWAIRRDFWRRLLASYSLDAALLDPDVLRQLLVRAFDPAIYGPAITRETVERALRDDNSPHNGRLDAKLVGDYAYPQRASPRLHTAKRRSGSGTDSSKQPPPIYVAITVADVATGLLTTVPANVYVVHALLAALAKPPLFPPVSTNGQLFVDASTLTAEPTQALLELLRSSGLVDDRAAAVQLYSVAPFPLGREALGQRFTRGNKPRRYTQLLDVVRRVLQLRRMRDATLERRLTSLHTRAMPRAGNVFFDAGGRRFVRMWVYPIEPEEPLEVNYLTLQANSEETRRRTMAETVADGCRATLQVMMPTAITDVAADLRTQVPPPPPESAPDIPGHGIAVRCRMAVQRHLSNQLLEYRPLPGAPVTPESGPGMSEVCEHCVLFRPHRTGTVDPHRPAARSATLLVDPRTVTQTPWPAQEAPEPDWVEPEHVASPRAPSLKDVWSGTWPLQRGAIPDEQRSIVSLLFSGGVFRGVFQVGVLNALSEASLRPDVVAGASVGSITSAMAMRTFLVSAYGAASAPTNTLADRQQFMQGLAAAYLAIDRLILTDRFADFVRGITVRAAQARFSIRDADRVIRRFDAPNPWTWSDELRRVVAGLERLAYVSPFELRDVVEAFRRQRYGTGTRLLERYFQELLDRAGVGLEVLGAEPLERLILDYVLQGLGPAAATGRTTLQEFLDHGVFFFATITNLTEGRLQNLGDAQIGGVATDLNLLQSLLASSAFPGVFRRRWSWEVQLSVTRPEEYADGGVIDNLPLDAVAAFLDNAATTGLIERRPPVPHLIFSASLETPVRPITDWNALDRLSRYWPRLQRRAREMAYNRKLDLFARTQQNLRDIITARQGSFTPGTDWTPLDIDVVTVIPQWLCGTFAFHPMLGFRRRNQAASIAHGCASGLLELGRQATGDDGPARAAAWGLDTSHLPNHAQSFATDPFVPAQSPTTKGNCWYRPTVPCPFSTPGQGAPKALSNGRTAEELNAIYTACGDLLTHRSRQPKE